MVGAGGDRQAQGDEGCGASQVRFVGWKLILILSRDWD